MLEVQPIKIATQRRNSWSDRGTALEPGNTQHLAWSRTRQYSRERPDLRGGPWGSGGAPYSCGGPPRAFWSSLWRGTLPSSAPHLRPLLGERHCSSSCGRSGQRRALGGPSPPFLLLPWKPGTPVQVEAGEAAGARGRGREDVRPKRPWLPTNWKCKSRPARGSWVPGRAPGRGELSHLASTTSAGGQATWIYTKTNDIFQQY